MRTLLRVFKWIVLSVIALAIAIPVLLGFVAKFTGPGLSTTAPKAVDAPWAIQTTSRIYYGEEFSIVQGVPELKNYWTVDNSKYKYHKGIIAFPENLYGPLGKTVLLIQRLSGGTK